MALLTPDDILNKQFTATKFREGYDIEEVDDYLDEVVRTLSAVQEENETLKAKLEAAERRIAELSMGAGGEAAAFVAEPAAPEAAPVVEAAPVAAAAEPENAADKFQAALGLLAQADTTAQATIKAANDHADQTRAEAKDESLRLVSEARSEAARIVAEAEETSHRTLTQLEHERTLLERKIAELRVYQRDYRTRMKSFLQNLLNDIDTKGDAMPTPAGQNAPTL